MKVFVPKALDKEGINLIPAFSSHVPEIIPMMKDFYKMFDYDFDEESATWIIRDLIKDQNIGRLWLIREEEELIGYVALIFSYSLGYGKTGLLDEFYLVESHRSKGIGRGIIEKVLDEAKNLKLVSVNLEVEKDNTIAKNLYASLGFKISNYEWHQKIL